MTALGDVRPAGLDLLIRPATTITVEFVHDTGELDGRTITAELDGQALDVATVGDTLTVVAPVAITGALTVGTPAAFELLEDLGGATPEVIAVGRWTPSEDARAVDGATFEVVLGTATVDVTVAGAQASVAALADDVTALDSRVDALEAVTEIVHDWDTDGWAAFTHQPVNPHGAATVTETVEDGRGRVTGQANSTDGNRRDWWLRDGTEWEDSEITSLLWGGSVYDGAIATPQVGHVHRAVEVSPGVWRAYVVTNNIFGGNPAQQNRNVWETDGSTLTLGSNGNSGDFGSRLRRDLTIASVEREFIAGFGIYIANLYVANPARMSAVESGDVIDSECSDSTFSYTGQAINGADLAAGYVSIVDPTTAVEVDRTPAAGTITPETHRRYWPFWLKSDLVDTVLRVKVWPLGDPEPPWTDPGHVGTFDTAGANDPAPDVAAAPTGPGLCGLVSAHLRSSAYLEFGEATFRQR